MLHPSLFSAVQTEQLGVCSPQGGRHTHPHRNKTNGRPESLYFDFQCSSDLARFDISVSGSVEAFTENQVGKTTHGLATCFMECKFPSRVRLLKTHDELRWHLQKWSWEITSFCVFWISQKCVMLIHVTHAQFSTKNGNLAILRLFVTFFWGW